MIATAPATAPEVAPDTASASAADDPFGSLNVAQRAAVEHDIGVAAAAVRPLLVVAGAGSARPARWRTAWRA